MQEYAKQWGQLVARAWSDDEFKARLLAEPTPALAEQGIDIPPGIEVQVHENTSTVLHMALPPKPTEDLSDEQLDAVAGGGTGSTAGCLATIGCAVSTVSSFSSAGSVGSVG
jgi:hypothetical protein